MDHVPSRATFANRRWPEEHVFPACAACNDKTRDSESIFAFYVRMLGWDDELRERDLKASLAIAKSVSHNFRDCFPRTLPQIKEHKLRRAHGITVNEGRFVEIPKSAVSHIELIYRKLCLALYYKYVGRVAARHHLVTAQLRFDAALMSTEELIALFQLGRFTHRTIKSGRFSGQFIYTYDFNPELDLFAIVAKFGGAFCGMAAMVPERTDDIAGLGPFVSANNALSLSGTLSEL